MPRPPLETLANQTVSLVLLVVLAVLVATAVLFAARAVRRENNWLPLLLIAGGSLAIVWEPVVDILGACWHPAIGQWTLFTAFDRPMPVWLGLAYPWYFGAQTALIWYALSRGKLRPVMLWPWWVAMIVSDIVLETVGLHFDGWIYYGQQPLVFLKFPLWWAATNSVGVLLAAVVTWKIEAYLRGPRTLLALLIPIATYAAANGAVAVPAFVAINAPVSPLVTQLCGVLCFVLSAVVVNLLVHIAAAESTDAMRAVSPRRSVAPVST